MIKLIVKGKNREERKEVKKMAVLIRSAFRNGCEYREEIYGYIIDMYFIDRKKELLKKQRDEKQRDEMQINNNKEHDGRGRMRALNYSDSVRRVVPEIIDELDKKFNSEEDMVITVVAEDFLKELGRGGRKFQDVDYLNVIGIIRRVLHQDGIEIREFYGISKGDKERKKFYEIRALTDEDVINIAEKNRKSHKRVAYQSMAKEVFKNKLNNDDEDSIWNDVEFIKKIGGCSFDIDTIDERVKREMKILLPEKIENGFGLLFL